jgi:transcriptional regulator with XRE-family HTH domain
MICQFENINANILVSMLKKLPILRRKRKLSQRALAELTGLSYVHIARMETGESDPRLSTLKALAKALKVKIGDLVH